MVTNNNRERVHRGNFCPLYLEMTMDSLPVESVLGQGLGSRRKSRYENWVPLPDMNSGLGELCFED